MANRKLLEALIGKKIIVFSGNQPHIGVLDRLDDDWIRLIIGDGDDPTSDPIPYLVPIKGITIIGENADAILRSIEEMKKRAAEKTTQGAGNHGQERKIISAPSGMRFQ